ncbi:uncharacterized protein, partial [Diadema setosum]|uniref:uncharacterized protein n=1 Tax=Diadema setosum TaxID=31175 RepID=UPI003B3AA588
PTTFNYGYGIYIYPVNFKMRVECYEGIPSVQLVDGPSPLEGLVVLKPDRYVCYDGFTPKAAELVCGELGFPAAEEYSAQTLPTTANRDSNQRLSCQEGSSFQSLMDCPLETTKCSSEQTVRLRCQGSQVSCEHPGHVYHGYWDFSITEFGSSLTLTCVDGYIINGSATLQCVGLPGRSTYFPVWNVPVPSCVKDVLSVAWFNHIQKRRHRRPEVSHQSNDHRNDVQLQYRRENVSSNPASTDSDIVSHPFSDHRDNRRGTLSAHQENAYHVSQNIADVDMATCPHAGVATTSLSSCHDYHSVQETSTDQYDCFLDREYQAKDRRMTNGAAKPCSKARMFDESYYNSLTFGIRNDDVCTRKQDANIRNAHAQKGRLADTSDGRVQLSEYAKSCNSLEFAQARESDNCTQSEDEHANQDSEDGRSQRDISLSSTGRASQRKGFGEGKDTKPSFKLDSSTATSSDEIFYYQVGPDNETNIRKTPLYAKVDKTKKM